MRRLIVEWPYCSSENMAEFEYLREPDCQIHTISLFCKKSLKFIYIIPANLNSFPHFSYAHARTEIGIHVSYKMNHIVYQVTSWSGSEANF